MFQNENRQKHQKMTKYNNFKWTFLWILFIFKNIFVLKSTGGTVPFQVTHISKADYVFNENK